MSSIGNGEGNVDGNVNDGNGDGNGKWCGGEETEEEREVRIRRLFDAFDSQRTGYVDGQQIESGLRSLRFPVQEQYARDLLEACDSNHDGRIDYSEFRRYMDAKELELYKVFQAIDSSRDGSLQPEEIRIALSRAGFCLFFPPVMVVLCGCLRGEEKG
jgi:Ca2+-binding EF-hand superfamily protein